MDQEEAPPPPYSAVDPLVAPASNINSNGDGNGNQATASLHATASGSEAGSSSSAASHIVPTHFTSAVTYFEQRPAAGLDESQGLLPHHMTIYPRSQTKDFPRRPRCWQTRMNEVVQQDWDTFLRYLFPPQLGLAAASQNLPRQLRAEIRRDRKDRPQETDEQRRARIAAVVDEWNQCFFELRGTRIVFVYIGEPDAAPASALCPRCYPAATKANQGTGATSTIDGRAQHAPELVPGQAAPSPIWPGPSMPMMPHGPMPFRLPYGVPHFPGHSPSPNHQPPQYYPHPPPGAAPWGPWNNWSYSQPQYGTSGSGKGGSFGWISDLTSKAQKYGERFAEQAEQYGNQLSQHAMHYGRQVEEQALAHGRWLEDQARYGRKQPASQGYPPAAYAPYPNWSPSPTAGPGSNPTTPITQSHPTPIYQNQPTPQPTAQLETRIKEDDKPPIEQTRRASISSTSSESSLSSIDSLSTTSDLSASDLATIRTQLQSLDDRHDRILYDAAVDLRHQLSTLQESRREARASGRRNWLPGTRPQQNQWTDSNDWGRWESPEQQQRASTERRTRKEEMRATRKAFRDVVRRAREEQRARRRVKRNRRRHGPLQVDDKAKASAKDQLALDGSLKNMSLNESSTPPPPIAQPQPQRAPMRSETSSEFCRSNIHTPSSVSQASVHEPANENPDKKKGVTPSRIKDMLKPRGKKRDEDKKKDGA